ncbi:Helix-turn-helix protein [Sanguibacter keddieii DSM 10542]|uniref:Helix-turn-helix protein n=2 Tax=Sanguibacter keddieii TaxID=60920 RepID=D1BJG8_SANKS|nr:Helix-turn-helix protein [Sanguibacter keddieii DSM 10542]
MTETGTSQVELARVSGVRQPSISQFLSGRASMSDDMLSRLLACMGRRLEVVRRPVDVPLDRSHRRSWLLHRELAAQLSVGAIRAWGPIVEKNLADLEARVQGQPHGRNLARWRQLVSDEDVAGVRRAMTGLDVESIEMREVSPLRGLLSHQDRDRVVGVAS